MAWLGNIASNMLRNVFVETAEDVVLEVRSDQYGSRHVHCREDGVVLYDPGEKYKDKYEIVLHRPCTETLHQAYRYNHIFHFFITWYIYIFTFFLYK